METEFQGYIILFLVWLVSTILVRTILAKFRTNSRLPPSPMALPIIGHLHLLAPIPHQALHKLSNRLGPLVHIFLGSVPCVVVSSPEMAKEFLKTHEASFSNRPHMAAVDYLTYGSADFSFAPYGPYWKFMKKLCMSELLGGRTLDQLLPVRREELASFIDLMLNKAKSNEAVDLGAELMNVTNNIISRMLMGQSCSADEKEADEVRKLVKAVAELTGKFNLSDFIWFCKNLDLQGFGKRLKEVRDQFDTMMQRIIKEHQEARKKRKEVGESDDDVKDLLDILFDISEDETSEIRLTRENIKAFILDIFAAGTDTSAITTEWALAELINHPDVMNKARQEIDTIVGNNRLVKESDIANLPYLQAIVKETLRLHPTGPLIVRESTEPCSIGGYEIPAKTRLFVNVWAVNRDPNHWEKPLEFEPERFTRNEGDGKSQLDVRGQHFHLLPFGSGRRGCPGTSLALQVVQTMLAAMIQCFEWKVPNGTVDMEEGPGLTLPRAHPLVCVPVARLNPFPSFE
ncbi:putative 3,9-dihydroxypterocarpan 6A-monooxygenase [Rosa chinensis]|uniref:Putative 3,9-dihydroxypterocarpan 6A-monooxygenase n=1 Tax=Rosa chinensis TaxID=74649 RepID=A0A2P6RDR4_ROSCH|nr:cytochrome P450 93A3 [Rosa chinensis]PRQ44545.1 putative 3,9-dihydroxypterocarpan 6A-monooxygenase [Rosa chinensis]